MQTKLLVLLTITFAFNAYAGSATWSANPSDGNWNTAGNWTPKTVPNGDSDTATFDVSNITDVSLMTDVEVNSIVFNPGASAYSINTVVSNITVSGAGIINNSGVTQEFLLPVDASGDAGGMVFFNSATAGLDTLYTLSGSFAPASSGGAVNFLGQSSAGQATFLLGGGHGRDTVGGRAIFDGDVSAENSTIICEPSEPATGVIAFVGFYSGHAANATLIAMGSDSSDGIGGQVFFSGDSKAENANLIAKGTGVGAAAGAIGFANVAEGDRARVELLGTGFLTIEEIDGGSVRIGSIEGDGLVQLGAKNLAVGRNNLFTVFTGVISGSGSLTKIGGGRLSLGGENTYTGGTHVQQGRLVANNTNGSATGSGDVFIDGGILGGDGIITGAVTVGTGSGKQGVLQPGKAGATPKKLTMGKSLTLNADGTCRILLNSNTATAAGVVAEGVTINNGALFETADPGSTALLAGTIFTVIDNTAATSIAGTFENLPDGGTITVGSNAFQANYEGGDGNDLTLTVVP